MKTGARSASRMAIFTLHRRLITLPALDVMKLTTRKPSDYMRATRTSPLKHLPHGHHQRILEAVPQSGEKQPQDAHVQRQPAGSNQTIKHEADGQPPPDEFVGTR